MGKIWIKELTGGLDTRRLPETTSGAVLLRATNGHITRGGEFAKRQAFVEAYTLPAGTIGLAADNGSLYVFGKTTEPVGMPDGVEYQRLQHPSNGALNLVALKSFDLYAGKIYCSVEWSNGDVHMYYDGDYVNSWADGLARGWVKVKANNQQLGESATGAFRITAGTESPGVNKITQIRVAGEPLLAAEVDFDDNNTVTAEAISTAINGYTATSGFTANSVGWRVNVIGPRNNSVNGEDIRINEDGDVVVELIDDGLMTGGRNGVVPTLEELWVGGVQLIENPVEWDSDAATMAEDIADAINAYSATSDFEAEVDDTIVNVIAMTGGEGPNGAAFTYTASDGFEFLETQPMSGGSVTALNKGTFLLTVDDKVYAVSGSVLYFSGIQAPTVWTTDAVGAGFIDMAAKISGTETLQALAVYQNFIAVFAESAIVIQYVDPDPTLNRRIQVLEQTGTVSPHSVTQYGDVDIYYLDGSGVRSLRARDSSNAAATADIGVLIDDIIIAKIDELTEDERLQQVFGLVEPKSGQFWLGMKDVIYIFSYYPGAKVSAWSSYLPTAFVDDEEVDIEIDYMLTFKKKVYIRDGDVIYVYGGLTDGKVFDECEAEVWLPYLDANDPSRVKTWQGVDAGARGEWEIAIGLDPNNEETEDTVADIDKSTFNHDKVPSLGASTHISARFRTTSAMEAKLSSIVILYEGDQIEDR